jgi:hypothetical protein
MADKSIIIAADCRTFAGPGRNIACIYLENGRNLPCILDLWKPLTF